MCRPRSASCRWPTGSSWHATPSNTVWTNRSIRVVLLIREPRGRCDHTGMTAPHHAVVTRLSAEFAAMSQQLARVSADLTELDRLLAQPVPAQPPTPQSYVPPAVHYGPPPAVHYAPRPAVHYAPPPQPVAPPLPVAPPAPRTPRDTNWIGKVLAVAGVVVTLVGVVLLLVLAAQAGILRPEIRVGAGALLAGALVTAAARLDARPGGRVGAIALAATGIAAVYMDVIAVTTIYHWLSAPVGLIL